MTKDLECLPFQMVKNQTGFFAFQSEIYVILEKKNPPTKPTTG